MNTHITSLGNAGVLVKHGSACFVIDAFYRGFEGVASSPWEGVKRIERVDAMFVTHAHWDHFNPGEVAGAVERTGAFVVGPAAVTGKLNGVVPDASLIKMEPVGRGSSGKYIGLRMEVGGLTVTAFRTMHSNGHNSYLIELPGLRLLHDGDNEHTQHFERDEVGNLDALMLCPWHGSSWADFIERIRPKHWFLIHMTGEELDQHARGEFMPDLCDRLPMSPVALRTGESFDFTCKVETESQIHVD